jgi:hypothetical protein
MVEGGVVAAWWYLLCNVQASDADQQINAEQSTRTNVRSSHGLVFSTVTTWHITVGHKTHAPWWHY